MREDDRLHTRFRCQNSDICRTEVFLHLMADEVLLLFRRQYVPLASPLSCFHNVFRRSDLRHQYVGIPGQFCH